MVFTVHKWTFQFSTRRFMTTDSIPASGSAMVSNIRETVRAVTSMALETLISTIGSSIAGSSSPRDDAVNSRSTNGVRLRRHIGQCRYMTASLLRFCLRQLFPIMCPQTGRRDRARCSMPPNGSWQMMHSEILEKSSGNAEAQVRRTENSSCIPVTRNLIALIDGSSI